MMEHDPELTDWIAEWQRGEDERELHAPVLRYVHRRSATLVRWLWFESTLGVVALAVLLYLVATRPQPFERLVMSTLALACAGMLLFGWWNWRGSVRAAGESTGTFLALSRSRLVRFRRALVAGWILLAIEMAAFAPWIWVRTSMAPQAEDRAVVWPWVLLLTCGLAAVVWLVVAARWARREAELVDRLHREYLEH